MAYANTIDTNRRIGTFSAVAAIHLVAGYALVTGLAAKFLPHAPPPPLVAETFKLPPPPPPPEQHPIDPKPLTKPTVEHDTHTVVQFDHPTFNPVVPTGDEGGALGGTGKDIGEVRIPQPDPPPLPTLVHGARPKGNPTMWVTPDDYPGADLRQEHSGGTRFRLTIGLDGRVTNCTVTVSSGYPGLDQAACAKLSARARFDPAIDSTGARLEGTYSSSVRWQIPE